MTLSADRLTVTLGNRTVLDEIRCALHPGELTAIIGPNGAGKSTLLRTLAGLLPPTHGSVMIDGTALATHHTRQRARLVGYLPQQRIVHWPLTVARTVALGRVPHESDSAANTLAVDRAMAEMDVAQFRDRSVTELSGGELARVLMARVLAQETRVLLADEPTAGLDPAHQLTLLEKLSALAKSGRTVAVALHELSLAARYCQRIILLRNGKILGDGPASQVLTPELLKAAFGINARVEHLGGVPVVIPLTLC